MTHPFESIMRSLIIAVYMLKADEIIVMGDHDCGMQNIDTTLIVEKMQARGVGKETLDILQYSGLDLNAWLHGFDDVEEGVGHDVNMIMNHPLIPKDVPVHGLVIDPSNGKVDLVVNGYENLRKEKRERR